MKRIGIIFAFAALFASFMTYTACDKHPVTTPLPPPTVTPTYTPVLSVITESTNTGFSPAAITISAGQGVIWTDVGPGFCNILMDQTGPTNGCTGGGKVLSPAPGPGSSVTYLFNSAPLTIDFQDTYNSGNGGAPCAPQPGDPFAGKVIVQ